MFALLRFFAFALLLLAPVATQAQDSVPEQTAIRHLLEAPFDGIDEDDVKAFYAARGAKPAWGTEDQKDPAPFETFLASIEAVIDYHGLNAEDYDLDRIKTLIASPNPTDRAKLDIVLTDTVLSLAHDLHGDYLDLTHLYPGWAFERDDVDVIALVNKAVATNSLAQTIADLAPKAQAYADLAKGLKTYRAMAAGKSWPHIASGDTLRSGVQDPRVKTLRTRLAAEGFLETDSGEDTFDKPLEQALIDFQLRNGLQPDGHLGTRTVAALNITPHERVAQIRANMERWRHMTENFPADSVIVNIPAMTVTIDQDGKAIYRGPVVVGRVDRKTPFIQSAIRSVIFNPAWHVPAKIARKDILPKLRRDPHYLEKMGLVINGSADDPHGAAIDWAKVKESEFNFRLRQTPGDMNSLGRLKFDFDNAFSVYMHGTPHQETFGKAERAQSSGCVRLRDPEKVAEAVLMRNEGNWTPEKIRDEVDSNKTKWVGLKENLPIYFVYWTAFRDETSGNLAFRRDIYDYDRFLLEAMSKPSISENDSKHSKNGI